ncbi:hypothetical protein PEC18_29430 [Paucibacter sp. O1-1]|nr:hypothetical protein [Paucibacter sp. O1-1]MDA3829863.1 hypothetical protein [Paucibacter sp. O1-1]
MTAQLSARDALFIEALGEMATVVTRVEALVPLLQDTEQRLIDANTQLSSQLRAFETRTHAIAEHAKVVAVTHIAQRADEMARKSMHMLALDIQEAARTALATQIRPTLQELIAPLNRLAHQGYQRERPWEHWRRWLTHAATATVASTLTLVVAALAWLR